MTAEKERWMRRTLVRLLVFLIALGNTGELFAAGHSGQVTLAGRPVPGAVVTVTQGERKVVTTTDAQGAYALPDLPDGTWTVQVEMRGFAKQTKEVAVAPDAMPTTWELTMLPVGDIAKATVPVPALPPPPVVASAPRATTEGDRPAGANANAKPPARPPATSTQPRSIAGAANAAAAAAPIEEPRTPDPNAGAADGLLIAGSVNNGASSPFAQSAAFGNFRPGQTRNPYRTQITFSGTAPWMNATPYSITGVRHKPDAHSLNLTTTIGGPLQFPGIKKRGPNFTFSYNRTANDTITSLLGRMPTFEQRQGDFSQGDTIVRDPQTGLPFPNNTIPANRINPLAANLLAYYPLPNGDPLAPTNHQASTTNTTVTHAVTFSNGRNIINNRNQVTGTVTYNRSNGSNQSLFAFTDQSRGTNLGLTGRWTHRVSPFLQLAASHAFTRSTNSFFPFFANVKNVSKDVGITNNDQDSSNWGPPTINLSGSVQSLSDGNFSSNHTIGNSTTLDVNWTRGKHNFTFGGLMRVNALDNEQNANSRGSFLFAGGFTGSPFADFLLGMPQSSSLAFSTNQDFHVWSYAAYIQDDLRLRPYLTLNLGLRWEFEPPIQEGLDRLVNLDIAPGFLAAAPVLASDPVGPLTGRHYPSSLVRRDITGIQPRVSMAWRPILGSSLLVRAGYDRTRSSGIARTLANAMSQQPPLVKTGNGVSTPGDPLNLSDGFIVDPQITQNTYAVDPDLRIAGAQNWQIYVQRDMPASMTMSASYIGTHGDHLIQQFLPNTYAPGAVNPCPTCPVGFRYVTSGGTSQRNAMRLEARRRTRNGLTASAQYTLARATDNSNGFGDATTGDTSNTAQNWLNLEAERGPSSFDQRHQFGTTVTYNTGVGLRTAFLSGWRGKAIRGWTIDGRMTMGSGMPVNPIFVQATPLSAPLRPSLTGETLDAPAGYYLNPAAYTAPATGTFGTASRNNGRGPSTFSLDGSLQRSFPRGRLNFDLRIDATNLLNHVVYTGVETLINSPQFGLPLGVAQMRRINTRLSVRF
jgi:hypothetical protein